MLLKETLKEINRLKSNCSTNSSIYTLLKGHRLLLLIRNGHMAITLNPYTKHVAITPNPCTKQHRNESCEYAICELTNPQSYCGDQQALVGRIEYENVVDDFFTARSRKA